MRHATTIRIGPVGFRVGSSWREPIAALDRLYAGYPRPEIADFTVRLEPEKPWRRWFRPSIRLGGDHMLPDASPLALRHGLLAAEMGMNLQMALGARRWLLLHAAVVERGGRALLLSGVSGSGKSTLAALLGERGWRLMGDEFALLDPASGAVHAFPRMISLKNEAIAVMAAEVAADRFGPAMEDTPKGIVRHLRPAADAIARMDETAVPALLLFPRFGSETAVRAIGQAELFVRLTQASTNYVALGEAGYRALSGLVERLPTAAIDYPDTAAALALVDELWAKAAA